MTVFSSFRTSAGVLEYAELEPIAEPAGTVVLVHGGGARPDVWLRTADGRPGWAPGLARAGYRAVVPTWPGLSSEGIWDRRVDRSGDDVAQGLIELLEQLDPPVVLLVHSMAGAFGYRIAFRRPDLLSGLVALAPAPPGDIQAVPEVIAEYADRIIVQGDPLVWELPKKGFWTPGPSFLDAKVIGSSQQFPPGRVEELRGQLIPIPARLLLERQNVNGTQVRFGTQSLEGLPVLLMVGSHDTDHPVTADQLVADWLRTRGATVDFVPLTKGALSGNGHALMLESNSDAILEVVIDWLRALQ